MTVGRRGSPRRPRPGLALSKMSLNAFEMDPVNTIDPATKEVPRTIEKSVRKSRSYARAGFGSETLRITEEEATAQCALAVSGAGTLSRFFMTSKTSSAAAARAPARSGRRPGTPRGR